MRSALAKSFLILMCLGITWVALVGCGEGPSKSSKTESVANPYVDVELNILKRSDRDRREELSEAHQRINDLEGQNEFLINRIRALENYLSIEYVAEKQTKMTQEAKYVKKSRKAKKAEFQASDFLSGSNVGVGTFYPAVGNTSDDI